MRGIAKVINGEIQLFATEGEQNEGAPVYVFETKEDFDAAVEGNLIPIGAIIVKTYDGTEMAGGPFDGELSEESDNAVQNKVLAAKMAQLDQAIADVLALRAGLETFGLSKICPVGVTDATQDNGMVLGACEKNAAKEGTLGNLIQKLNAKFSEHISNVEETFLHAGIVEKSTADNMISHFGINAQWTTVAYFLKYDDVSAKKTFLVIGTDCSDTLANSTSTGIQVGFTSHGELLKRSCAGGTWTEWIPI